MGLDVYVDSADEYYIEQAISNAKRQGYLLPRKENDSVLFDELFQHRKEAESLSMALSSALTAILRDWAKNLKRPCRVERRSGAFLASGRVAINPTH